ncbi:MAG: DUF5693 family protein, partial [Syntrophomonas sp.]
DYGEFKKTASLAHRDMDDVLQKLKDSGVKEVAVNEVTLRDLANNGDVRLSSFAEFSALVQNYFPDTWQQAQKAIGDTSIDPVNLTVVTSNPDTAKFLQERLGSRFTSDELISFKTNGQSYFIITSELDAVNTEVIQADKNKTITRELDARLGFDEKVLQKLKSMGFDIILRPANNTGSNTKYLAEYQKYVQKYNVKLIVFAGNKLSQAPHVGWAKQLVHNNELTIGIIEAATQLQYVKQDGLDELMEATRYPINRVYSSSNDDFVSSPDERYYRWVRGVIDRGIRILYVVPFKDQKVSYSQALDDTINMIDKFHHTILDKGFTINQPLNHLSAQIPGKMHRLMVSFSLVLAGLLYLMYLFKMRRWLVDLLLAAGISICLALNLLLNIDISKVYALAAAILYPSLSSLLLLLYLRNHQETSLWAKIPVSLAIILIVNALGMYTVVTSLADIRYIMNVKIFSGVKLAFLTPLLLFILNYYCCFSEDSGLKNKVMEFLHKQPNYLVLFILMVGAVAVYIYLGRSGNTSGIQVSSLEVRLREILENLFLARPRFKELIIGYPSLLAMIYLYHKYKQSAIVLVLGLGVMMGSISMVNSFCHVFTAVTISLNRTMGGLLIGIILGLLLIVVIKAGEWLVQRIN